MIGKLQSLGRKLTEPRAMDEDEARREYFVNVILVGAGAIDFVYSLMTALAYCTMTGVPLPALLAGVLTLPLIPLGLWLSRRGWWRVAALVPLLGLLAITIYGRYHFGEYDVAIVLYGAIVLIAGIVYGSRVAAGATMVSVLSYGIVGWLQLDKRLPPTGDVGLPSQVIAIGASLGIIALLQWLFTSQLQQALRKSRTYAQELSKHREHLEELVKERTAALSAANAQLQQKIAEREKAEAERERLLAAERALARRQAALLRLSAELAATLDEAEVCRRVVNGLRDTLGHDFVALCLVDETTGDRVVAASVGFVEPPTRIPPGEGLSERPLLDGQLQYTPDVTQDPRYFHGMGGSEVDVPVRIGGEVVGVLIAESRQTQAFNQDDLEVLTAAAQQAGLAIEKARLLAAERQRADELDALRITMADVTAELELSALLRVIVERAAGLLEAAGGELGLYDEANQEIRIVVSHNLDKDYVGTRMALGEGAMGRVAESGEPLIIEDYRTWEGRPPEYADLPVHASLNAPLAVGGRLVGVISTAATDPARQFVPADLHLLNLFAQQAAIAIENARLYDQAQREIVERKRSEERYRSLFDGVPVGLFRSTPAGPMVDANLALVEILGFPSREDLLAADPASDYVDPEERVQGRALLEREGIVRDFEVRMRRYDGTVIWVRQIARAVKDEQGQVLYYEGSLEDITERKKFEEEIRRQKEYFEALFVNSPVAALTADLDAKVVSWNPMAERLFGYTQEEAIGKHVDDLVANDPRIQEEALDYTKQAFREGRVQGTTKRTRKDGSLVDVEARALPVIVAEETVAYIAIYHDISELQQTRRAAEAANQAKSTFLANMSHELRTPLNAIVGFTRLVKRRSKDILPQKQLDNLDKVLISADHLLGLINDVLDLSKIEAGRTEVQPVAFSLEPLVDACLQTVRPLVKSEQLRLVKEIEPDLPTLFTDQDKVRQILINLLSNALKFTEEGTITVTAQRRGETLTLAVADTGIGIPEEALERIFEAFQQLDDSTTRKYGGTGLGLSISQHLAQLLGGDITVESEVGVGSTFTVALPIRYTVTPRATVAVPLSQAPSETTTVQPKGGPLVLVIDDDPNVIYLLQENLAEAGYRVVGATSGDEGVRKARELKPFAIILDILMPPKDGWQVLHELKADAATRDIPVVVLSIVDNRELGYRLGAFDYLVKPFDREAILSTLSRIAPAKAASAQVRLLVVDDDPQVVDLVSQLLEGEAYDIQSAADGQEALETVSQQCPDIILLDLLMPRLDGFGVIEQLRQCPERGDIPIVVLTAKTLTADELAKLQQRVSKVIQKHALERETLLRELQSALQAYRRKPVLSTVEGPGPKG